MKMEQPSSSESNRRDLARYVESLSGGGLEEAIQKFPQSLTKQEIVEQRKSFAHALGLILKQEVENLDLSWMSSDERKEFDRLLKKSDTPEGRIELELGAMFSEVAWKSSKSEN
jgi:hypothetical protein